MKRDSSLQLATQALLNPNGLRRVDTYKARPTAVFRDSNKLSPNDVLAFSIVPTLEVLSVIIQTEPIRVRIQRLYSRVSV
jgi:hypothetical protein